MSPVKALNLNQCQTLHQSFPPPDCCLCNERAKTAELQKQVFEAHDILNRLIKLHFVNVGSKHEFVSGFGKDPKRLPTWRRAVEFVKQIDNKTGGVMNEIEI